MREVGKFWWLAKIMARSSAETYHQAGLLFNCDLQSI
jgi:hypothetical protein